MDYTVKVSDETYEVLRTEAYKTRRTLKAVIDKKFKIKRKRK